MKNKINIITLFILSLFSIIILNDYFCFIFKINYNFYFYCLSIVLVCLSLFLLRKKIEIIKPKLNRVDIIFLIIIVLIFLARIAIPDSSFDTLNYHIYLQERPFSNNVSENFFPARWINTFSFPLSDRVHYLFRLVFGYRYGIIGNLIFIIIVYYQIKEILLHYIKNDNYISLISIAIIICEQLLYNMSTYYVDILSIPLFLEILIILLNHKTVNNYINYIVLFLSGILVSLKVSNAILIIPFGIIYIKKHWREFDYKTFLIGIPVFFFPLLVYLLNNYIQTGNPVFPFYNSIFKSKYLSNENWIENYYGPKNFIERIFWPVYLFENPRRAFDTDVYYNRIGFGYIISLFIVLYNLIRYFINKKNKISKICYLSILFIVLCLLWSNFMMGYIRYALVLEVLSGIIIAVFIYDNFKSKNILLFVACLFSIYGLFYTSSLTLGDMLNGTDKISWRKSYIIDKENHKDNLDNINNYSKDYNEYVKNIDCFGIVDYNAGYAALLSKSSKIINLNEGYSNEYGKEKFKETINKCKNIYTISTSATIDRTLQYLSSTGYKKIGNNIEFKTDFINYNQNIVLFEIEKE